MLRSGCALHQPITAENVRRSAACRSSVSTTASTSALPLLLHSAGSAPRRCSGASARLPRLRQRCRVSPAERPRSGGATRRTGGEPEENPEETRRRPGGEPEDRERRERGEPEETGGDPEETRRRTRGEPEENRRIERGERRRTEDRERRREKRH
ncbi:hypothetical protein CesoFtcFv8_021522 [Champsocephalus esox]|uniref:Uncharacterized protein n=1 Tax=Champsocephalus esox TaxID=159716 RepID=A0AAN8GMH1_9TELE|nr:hypothetical protein CesoFtcFv8_021522 [Champsocephalus esox]